ncbi:Protein YceI [Candidatus Methylomirabilis lanthanidiphila]|uniref:Protein YceI n=1 Tax=Candidatus Methylomirabilis lanthanidiphila TaxID=2211376 RepID=A0A564ZJR1_9BACT|nr:YceI family protein [Candidatus Methylomirabilis lanthanidiphila]VUZ85107.1 Protein YceI [Candidatus Methylomirabilis lanthanidiphila]
MSRWVFEPGHTAAEFCVRHMMVTYVRGHFKDVHGTLEFDPEAPAVSGVEAVIDARGLWSGEPDRDTHLRGPDFLDVERFPEITFRGRQVRLAGANEAVVVGDLTLRGVTRSVDLHVRYLGQWQTPWWKDGVDTGPKTRAGFLATARINRHDFGVSWNSALDRGGVVVGDDVTVTIDAEAILQS